MVSEDLASSTDSKVEEEDDERKRSMELNKEGVLKLEECPNDDLDSLNGLFHCQMEDYEVFPSCNMLG